MTFERPCLSGGCPDADARDKQECAKDWAKLEDAGLTVPFDGQGCVLHKEVEILERQERISDEEADALAVLGMLEARPVAYQVGKNRNA